MWPRHLGSIALIVVGLSVHAEASVIITTDCSGCMPRPFNATSRIEPLFDEGVASFSAPLRTPAGGTLGSFLRRGVAVNFGADYLNYYRSQIVALESVDETDAVVLRASFEVDGDLGEIEDAGLRSLARLSPDFGGRPTQLEDTVRIDTELSVVEFVTVLDAADFAGKDFRHLTLLFQQSVGLFATPESPLPLTEGQLSNLTITSASLTLGTQNGSGLFSIRIPEPSSIGLLLCVGTVVLGSRSVRRRPGRLRPARRA